MLHAITLLCCLLPLQEPAVPATKSAALLPATTIATVEIPDPVGLVTSVVRHPFQEHVRQDERLAAIYATPQFLQAKVGLSMAEIAIGMKWPDALRTLAGNGITIAADPNTDGVAAILRSGDPEKLPELMQRVLTIAGTQREKNNQPPIRTSTYRDITVHRIDSVGMAVLPDMILLTNNQELGKWMLDAALDGNEKSLQANSNYTAAIGRTRPAAGIRAFVDVAAVRAAGGLAEVMKGTRSNPVAELILGGILDNLSHTPFVAADLVLDDTSLSVTMTTPHQADWVTEPREFYFGPRGAGRAPAAIPLDGTILNLSAYRDVAKMWLYAGDLFDQQVNDGFAEAETTLSTLFAGKDFVEEILAEIDPQWQLIVARQEFADRLPRPSLKLPSFALVGRFRDSAKMNPELRRTFFSMVGFFNVVGAMEGNPQLDQSMLREGGFDIVTSSFVPTPEDRESTAASIHYNFTPSLALGEGRFILSSSLPLARQIAQTDSSAAATEPANASVQLHAGPLRQSLSDNREQLIANNMLEEGHSREEAEGNIDLLLTGLGWFDRLSTTLVPGDDSLSLRFRLSLAK